MRAKEINETIGGVLTGKELSGGPKTIFDASVKLNNLGIETSNIRKHSYESYYFAITNHRFNKIIEIEYHLEAHEEDGIKANTWEIWNANDNESRLYFDTWDETVLKLINILHPNIEKDLEETKMKLNMAMIEQSFLEKRLDSLNKISNKL